MELRVYARLALLSRGKGGLAAARAGWHDADRLTRAFALRASGDAVARAGKRTPGDRLVRFLETMILEGLSNGDDMVIQLESLRQLGRLARPEDIKLAEPFLQAREPALRVEAAGAILRLLAN